MGMGSVLAPNKCIDRGTDRQSWSDEDLLVDVAQGDRESFSVLYDRMSVRVVSRVLRSLVDYAQSEEVAQDVFLEVWQNAARFNPNQGRAAGWILMIAHRRAVDRVRSVQASRTRDLTIGIRNQEPLFDLTSETVQTKVEFARATAALQLLTDVQRETVVLTYQDGRSNQEIANMLNLPVGTIKTRLRDGLLRLRGEMSDYALPARA
jgi:RNA polymerase sigma-70 factor (ECF subfamily)